MWREHHVRAVLESALDAVVGIDANGTITYWNPRAEIIFGWAKTEAVGQELATLVVPERYRESHRRGLERFLTTGQGPILGRRIEISALRRDGSEFPIELAVSSFRYRDTTSFNAFIRDITDQKRTETPTRSLTAELEDRVVERTTQLKIANEELEAFSYSVSHDLRAPLRHIDAFSQILLKDYAGGLDAQGREYLRLVCQGTERMKELIDALLKLSRVTRASFDRRLVDLSAVAKEIVGHLQDAQPERDVEFVIEDAVTADGDPHLLRIALDNLFSNAWKFTSKQPRARVEFGRTHEEGEDRYFVRDNGAGFDMAYADKLFQPFQRVHSAAEFPGTGIGLATVGRIVHRHGGRVWAKAETGSGATFYFTLKTDP